MRQSYGRLPSWLSWHVLALLGWASRLPAAGDHAYPWTGPFRICPPGRVLVIAEGAMTAERGLLCRHQGREVWLDPRRKTRIGTDISCEVVLERPGHGVTWATIRMLGGWHVRPLDGTEVALGSGPWRGRPAWIEGEEPVLLRLRRDGHEATSRCGPAPADTGSGSHRGSSPRYRVSLGPDGEPASATGLFGWGPPVPIPGTMGPARWLTIGRQGGTADRSCLAPTWHCCTPAFAASVTAHWRFAI